VNIRRGLLSQLSSFFPFPFFLYKIDLPADIHGHHALTKCVLRCEIHFSAAIRCRIHYWTLSHTTFHTDMMLFHWWDPGLSFSGFQARHVKLFIMCFLDILHSHWTCSYISHQNTDIIVAFHTQQKISLQICSTLLCTGVTLRHHSKTIYAESSFIFQRGWRVLNPQENFVPSLPLSFPALLHLWSAVYE